MAEYTRALAAVARASLPRNLRGGRAGCEPQGSPPPLIEARQAHHVHEPPTLPPDAVRELE